MAKQDRVDELVLDLLDSGRTPEEICRDCPELLSQVRTTWLRVRAVDAELSSILPDSNGFRETHIPFDGELPQLPGYEMQRVLGRGGVAIVYLAQHVRLERSVAVKMLLAGQHAKAHELDRFSREARSLAGLHHPNIVQIFDVADYNGCPYFTMEYLNGGTLSDRVKERPMPAKDAARITATFAEAIHVAHQSEIIHRDLTPSNILFTADGVPKITDFGLARHLHETNGLTRTGAALGTPGYMAPEQADGRGSEIGPAADVYGLGAILYKLLTGRPPFQAETTALTIRQLLFDEPLRPSKLNPSVPRDLETICLKCLSKEPQERYETAAALADDLRRFERGEPILARPIGPLARAVRWARRRPALAGALAAGVLLASALVVTVLWWHVQQDGARGGRRGIRRGRPERVGATAGQGRVQGLGRRAGTGQGPAGRICSAGAARPPFDGVRQPGACHAAGRHPHCAARSCVIRTMKWTRRKRTATTRRRSARRGWVRIRRRQKAVAARVGDSPVRKALVAALDDWAGCTPDKRRRAWLLRVARLADPDPWRDRVRDPRPGGVGRPGEAGRTGPDGAGGAGIGATAGCPGSTASRTPARRRTRSPFCGGCSRPILRTSTPTICSATPWLEVDQYGDAVGYFRAALAVRPGSTIAWANLGYSLLPTADGGTRPALLTRSPSASTRPTAGRTWASARCCAGRVTRTWRSSTCNAPCPW